MTKPCRHGRKPGSPQVGGVPRSSDADLRARASSLIGRRGRRDSAPPQAGVALRPIYAGLTEGELRHLLKGQTWGREGFLVGDAGWTFDAEAARVAWGRIRAEAVRDWIATHPCSRPWAWWHFDAPEGLERPRPLPEWRSETAHRHLDALACRDVLEGYAAERDVLEAAGVVTAEERERLAELLRERGPTRSWSWWNVGPGRDLRPDARLAAQGDPPMVAIGVGASRVRLVAQGRFLRERGLLTSEELAFYGPDVEADAEAAATFGAPPVEEP